MSAPQIQAALKRFAKGFVAGGLAQVGAMLAAGVTITNLLEAKALLWMACVSFVTGGLLGVEKMLRWQEPLKNVTIDSLPQ